MYLVFAGMIAGTPVAIPQRIDAEPVSVWVTTGGLVDDRPPRLTIDRSVLSMDGGLADAPGLPTTGEPDWHLVAADLAELYDQAEAPADSPGDEAEKTSIHSETAPAVTR